MIRCNGKILSKRASNMRAIWAMGLLFGLVATWNTTVNVAQAASVEVKGLHLACPCCATELEAALAEVKGLTKVTVDRGASTATFQAPDAKAIQAALLAVRGVGFVGKVTVDGKANEFPVERVKAGTTAVKAKFVGPNQCCPACAQGIVRALSKNEQLGLIECDPEQRTVIVEGRGGAKLDLPALQQNLFDAGFAAKLEAEVAPPAPAPVKPKK